MSDFSVDVAEYDDSDDVVVSHSVGFARQLVSEDEIGSDVEETDFVLSPEDAPTSVEKFIVPEEDQSEISIPEPTMVKLVDPTSNSANEMDADLMNEDWNVTDSAPVLNSEDKDVNSLLTAFSKTIYLNKESLIDKVTAISGSGPGYIFCLVEVLSLIHI